ncbi:hypothetical protein AMAG_05529 [Allomyces macrogynus ATCC 38327]|uniref:Uncharacterized protein n=1 Tax=Allomyces macrogynus (strain ATCC 38327) TaxID=578462 RepID=A0A0L0SCF5_ALLM3|nr:hypothetical protein AMAG_05529 [Allomyces macrogynus ATCC 38327]|eukprot:KNE60104.1 hypothetical protein AMAG_05529 [Allomyces macrogynus ATCC 38327]
MSATTNAQAAAPALTPAPAPAAAESNGIKCKYLDRYQAARDKYLAACTGPTVVCDESAKAELRALAARSLENDVDPQTTFQLTFQHAVGKTTQPSVIYLLMTLGFQVDDFAVLMGQLVVDVRYRGLPRQVLAEIKDAPTAVALLASLDKKTDGDEAAAAAADSADAEKGADGADDAKEPTVDERDRLYHVEMDVSQDAWAWAWNSLRELPGLDNVMEV